MRRIIQISGWLLFIMGLIIIMLLSGNEYQWMQDMDPSMTALPQGNGNREIIKMLIYFILIIVQIALYFFFSSPYWKVFFSLRHFAITDYRMEF